MSFKNGLAVRIRRNVPNRSKYANVKTHEEDQNPQASTGKLGGTVDASKGSSKLDANDKHAVSETGEFRGEQIIDQPSLQ